MCGTHLIRTLAHLTPSMHARREHGGDDLGANVIQRLGEDAHRVAWGSGGCVLKGDGEDDALAGKDSGAVALVPAIQESLKLSRRPPPVDRRL
jgi:hypothetical protein